MKSIKSCMVRLMVGLASLSFTGSIHAEEPVVFNDTFLKIAVEDELWITDPTPTDMLELTQVIQHGDHITWPEEDTVITDLTGLEYALNLQKLSLRLNLIKDISVLSELANLRHINLSRNNRIEDLSPLAGLTRLEHLDIHENKIYDITPLAGLTNLRYLDLHGTYFEDASTLSTLTSLRFLILYLCPISDISPLSALTKLQYLHLNDTRIDAVTPLAGLSHLKELHVHGNQIQDVGALRNLKLLKKLILTNNPLNQAAYRYDLYAILRRNPGLDLRYDPPPMSPTNVSVSTTRHDRIHITWHPVYGGPHFTTFYRVYRSDSHSDTPLPVSTWQRSLEFEDMDVESGRVYRYRIQTAFSREGATAGDMSDPVEGCLSGTPALKLDSTSGGTVTVPGEGVFLFSPGEITTISAASEDPDLFVFSGWAGTAVEAGRVSQIYEPVTAVEVHDAHTLRAQFATTQTVLHVSDSAKGDAQAVGTEAYPLGSIQAAIDVAVDGMTIVIQPGIYEETLNLLGKNILITGMDDTDADIEPYPVIRGHGIDPVVSFVNGEGADCILKGLVLTGGRGGILCYGASPTIQNCLVVGNGNTDPDGGAITLVNSRAALINCTVAQNRGLEHGSGLMLAGSDITLKNSILWGNVPLDLRLDPESQPDVHHNTIGSVAHSQDLPASIYQENLMADPNFVQSGEWYCLPQGECASDSFDLTDNSFEMGDYHLMSREEGWDRVNLQWQEAVTSPCIDAGDPSSPIGAEPEPHGGIINMGAYGGSNQASSRVP